VQPAEAVGEICRDAGVPYILDACQAVGRASGRSIGVGLGPATPLRDRPDGVHRSEVDHGRRPKRRPSPACFSRVAIRQASEKHVILLPKTWS
jgi:hypothetical protein